MVLIARCIWGLLYIVSILMVSCFGVRWIQAIWSHHQSLNEYWAIKDHGSPEGWAAFNKTCDRCSETDKWFPWFMASLLALIAVAVIEG